MSLLKNNKKKNKRTFNLITSDRIKQERHRNCLNCRTRLAPKENTNGQVYFCPKCGTHFNIRDTSPEFKLQTSFGGVKSNGEVGIMAQKSNDSNFQKNIKENRKANDFLLKKELVRKDKNNNFDFLKTMIDSQSKITFAKITNPKERKYHRH